MVELSFFGTPTQSIYELTARKATGFWLLHLEKFDGPLLSQWKSPEKIMIAQMGELVSFNLLPS